MGTLIVEKTGMTFHRNVISEREFNKTNKEVFGKPECWKCEIPIKGKSEDHVGIFKDVTNAILNGAELLAPGYEGINGLTISNAMHYSAWTGKTVDVKNFPHDEFYELLQERIANSTMVKKVDEVQTADTEGAY